MALRLPIDDEAVELLNRDPLALLIGVLLDQQVPLEWAFRGPADLRRRLGHELDVRELAGYEPDELTALFAGPPALHRYPRAMADRTRQLCRQIIDRYDGDPAAVWVGADSGAELLRRAEELPGFATRKAQILVALLGKRFEVRPPGWREAAGGYGDEGVYRSVADVTDANSLALVREHKRRMKAELKRARGG